MYELYVVARRVLLDSLEALGPHCGAAIVVGAQAIYMRAGEADLAVAPYTTDGDLAIDPSRLAEVPPLEQVLLRAGFQPRSKDSVGIWIAHRPTRDNPRTEVQIDLLVPASVSPGKGRRSAMLPGHDARAARIVRGIEGVLVDADVMKVAALDAADGRALDVRVAGPAALLVSKLHKIHERSTTPRSADKDALDVLRLLRGTTTADMAGRMRRLLDDGKVRPVAEESLALLRQQFASRAGVGTVMALKAIGSLDDPEEIADSCVALSADLLDVLGA